VAEAAAVLRTARDLWAASGRVTAAQLAMTELVTVAVAELPGTLLGVVGADRILIDANAAGHGWFVDPTPFQAEEFAPNGLATPASPAAGRMDLLSVVVHELGHVMGLGHAAGAGDAMSATLSAGQRLSLATAEPTVPEGSSAAVWDEANGAFLDAELAALMGRYGLAAQPPSMTGGTARIDWSRGWSSSGPT
jgi:hypothetical protein